MAKRIISITLAVIVFLGAIVATSFGSRAIGIEQAGADFTYIPTTTAPPTTTQVSAVTTTNPYQTPGYWLTTVPDGPFKTSSGSLTTTTEPTTQTTTAPTTEPTTTTTTTTTTTRPTTTTTRPTTTTTRPSTSSTTVTTTKPTTTTTQKPVSVSIQYVNNALLYDVTNDKILFEKNASTKCYPASTTKLLTASVALYYMHGDTLMTVGDEIKMIGYDSSVCGLEVGYKLTLSQLITGLMMNSGNDAAYTIAVNVARFVSGNSNMSNSAAVKYFASLMNDFAKRLGATGSNFVNPDGYHDPNHYSTARDLLLIAKEAMKYSVVRNAGSTYEMKISTLSGEWLTFKNTNSLINPNSQYYYPAATGLKTGMTYGAGYCLIATATKDGRTLLSIAMGASNDKGRCTDTINMFNAGFSG
ncbi:MAG: D-alanyl-D-alanine carboxypeptidase [Clostridia bacterium]|nr:D-alanyl-D-alanine carboxypeptidase [Clostridia bacterium]